MLENFLSMTGLQDSAYGFAALPSSPTTATPLCKPTKLAVLPAARNPQLCKEHQLSITGMPLPGAPAPSSAMVACRRGQYPVSIP